MSGDRGPCDQRGAARRVLDECEQRVGLVQRLAREIGARAEPAEDAAGHQADGDVRRLQGVAASGHRARLQRDEAEAPVAIRGRTRP